MGAGGTKPEAEPKAEPTPAPAPEKKPDPAPTPAKSSTPTPPVAKAESTPPAETVPKTAAEAAASIAAGTQPKEEDTKAKAKPKGESKAKGKAKSKDSKSKPKAEGEQTEKKEFQCCVRNLSEDATEDQLKSLFTPFGTVGTITMIRKPDGKCRGLAFVSLGSADEVTKAIAEMDKKSIDGKEISVAMADGKKDKSKDKDKDDSKGAKGKSKGKEKSEKGASEKGKGKGKGKKGEERRPSQQVGYIPPQPYGQQPMYGYQYPYNPYQYAYGATPQMQAAQLAQMQYMAQSMYATQLMQQGAASPKASGAVPPGPVNFMSASVDSTEYSGTLISLSTRNGYGFIDWPENNANKWFVHDDKKKEMQGKPRHVYIAAEMLPEGAKTIGSKLKFTYTVNSKGHPQASSCKAA